MCRFGRVTTRWRTWTLIWILNFLRVVALSAGLLRRTPPSLLLLRTPVGLPARADRRDLWVPRYVRASGRFARLAPASREVWHPRRLRQSPRGFVCRGRRVAD